MRSFIFIFINIILPILIQIAIGFGLNKVMDLNVSTLSRVQFYIFIPALLFTKIYNTDLDRNLLVSVVLYSFILFGLLYFISCLAADS